MAKWRELPPDAFSGTVTWLHTSPEAIVRAALKRAAYEAFEAGCGWQELRSAALSSMWPEDASKHLASEQAAFAVAGCIRSLASDAEVAAIIKAAGERHD
jgi:hypothetical protein